MIYPIVAYGHPILRQKASEIEHGTDVRSLAQNMLATMEHAKGVGLAAPQIGQSIQLFVANMGDPTDKHVLINPVLTVDTTVPANTVKEGCLSIPNIMVNVPRHEKITIRYFDADWQLQEASWTGFPARVLQHEYDHLLGKLHIDYASTLRKRLLKSKLAAIRHGNVAAEYKMTFSP